MASLNINDFKAKLAGAGARPNRFRVILNFPVFAQGDTELASFMVKSASLPPVTIGEIPIPFRGRELFVPGDKKFDPWEVTVINDTGFEVRDALVRWSNGINDNATNVAGQDPSDWYADLVVEQLGNDEEVLKTYTIHDAFPQLLGAVELSNESTDAIEEFPVTFRYLFWD